VTVVAETPADQVRRVAGRIASYLTRYDAAHDPRAVFAYTYLRLTTTLESSLRANDPPFRSPAWVSGLAEALAAQYFVAMDRIDGWLATHGGESGRVQATDLPDEVSQPWRDVYAATTGGRSYVLEDVLFAMMAHMSYDLPLALREMAEPQNAGSHIDDFHTMNAVLGNAIDRVQQEVASRYSRGLAVLDQLLAGHDEILSNYGIRMARGMAWYNADRLQEPTAAAAATKSIGSSTGAFIHEVRSPDDWRLRLALHIGRRLIPERRSWPIVEHPDAVKWQEDGPGPVTDR
jgi:Family of unknown function (DUF5995)